MVAYFGALTYLIGGSPGAVWEGRYELNPLEYAIGPLENHSEKYNADRYKA